MSAIAGVFRPRGGEVDPTVLSALAAALAPYGPDGMDTVHQDRLAVLHRPFWTTPGQRFERQPLVTDQGDIVAWDGRLDNADEIARALAADAPAPSSALLLAAYHRWGVDAFARILGDFAIVIWDRARQRLVLARDPFGLRPLFVYETADTLVWASRPRALVDGLGLSPAIDEDYIAAFMLNLPADRSPFRGIEAVPPAHALVVDAAGRRLERYWRFDPSEDIRYRRDEEYEDHFNEIFRAAVACRMRADGPVYAELSGGIDSSSIVCVGDRLLAEGVVDTPSLHTASYLFRRASSSDEGDFVRLVEAQRGCRGLHIDEADHPILAPLAPDLRPDFPTNQLCFMARHDHLSEAMGENGARVLLSGLCGDPMFWGEPPDPPVHLADRWQAGRLRDLLREAHRHARVSQVPLLTTLWRGVAWPLLPRRWQARSGIPVPLGEWLASGFVRRNDLRERRLGLPDDLGFTQPSQALQYAFIRGSMRTYAYERVLSRGSVEMRYPYLDRRIVSFGLAIPFDQKLRPGETRSVVRRALRGVVPEAIRTRVTKGGPAEAFHRAIASRRPLLEDLFASPRCADLGIIDAAAFREALRAARHGRVSNLVQLIRTISVELWLRTLETRAGGGADFAPFLQPAAANAAPSFSERRL